jgi:hypothetical protein
LSLQEDQRLHPHTDIEVLVYEGAHHSCILNTLGLQNRAELVAYGAQQGFLSGANTKKLSCNSNIVWRVSPI